MITMYSTNHQAW